MHSAELATLLCYAYSGEGGSLETFFVCPHSGDERTNERGAYFPNPCRIESPLLQRQLFPSSSLFAPPPPPPPPTYSEEGLQTETKGQADAREKKGKNRLAARRGAGEEERKVEGEKD